jgi:hypothetical protein
MSNEPAIGREETHPQHYNHHPGDSHLSADASRPINNEAAPIRRPAEEYNWDAAFEREERERIEEKVRAELDGWRGGNG